MESAAEISRALSARAEAFCRSYLPNGRVAGNYWQVGDAGGTEGSSLAVRLSDGSGRAGKWTDYATGEHGDLLDIIPHVTSATSFLDVMNEARRFLSRPEIRRVETSIARRSQPSSGTRSEKAARLFAAGKPVRGSLAQAYLFNRDVTRLEPALRFHPGCYYRDGATGELASLPAMLAAITDEHGKVMGVARTWLDPERRAAADVPSPKRVMGDLLGHAVRFGTPGPVLAAGEGIETMLSIGTALPLLPLAACLTATHLGLFEVPDGVRELWICRDNDAAGERASQHLRERLAGRDILIRDFEPVLGDFNDDLSAWGDDAMRTRLVADYGESLRTFMAG